MNKAGCILIDIDKKGLYLVYRENYKDYSFPKGHIEKGESLIECAIRETEEETKIKPYILDNNPIYIDKYNNINVYYYLAKSNGKSDNKSLDTHKTYLIPFDEVYDRLTYDSQKEMYLKIKDIIIDSTKS